SFPTRRSSDLDIEGILSILPVQDLRFLCQMFRLTGGRSKEDLLGSLLDSDYSLEEIARPANEILFGLLVEGYVPKPHWVEILVANGLASSGSRHDLLLLLIENRLLDPKGTLEALNPSQLRNVFYDRFDRVLTAPRDSGIGELLDSFGFRVARRIKLEVQPQAPGIDAPGSEHDLARPFAGDHRPIAHTVRSSLQAR